ncbi:extracellular solute-binding protein [Streptomyces phaeochromogenes]|uniref:Extracellular solute-binding protein n=1 Tax=Streptomyces phaeochromogenes TaxID=1923 RepID=A0ABZ1HM88_STRPH|nr:extracellular solute-binding protein [Streptomyces phaeochromogenes]WSD19723.1 extracellular solute-binding protein [Streptomyces phaeochromogenes]
MRTTPGALPVLLLTSCLLTTAACANSTSTGSSSQTTGASQKLAAAAREEALAAADGKKIGGKVTMLGINGGAEGKLIKDALKPFTDATGIQVDYTGNEDLATVVQTRVQAGNPPDVVDAADLGSLLRYAKQGKLVDLGSLIGTGTLKSSYPQSLLDAATVNGKTYGVFTEIDNFMVWYNPKTYKGPKAPATWAELEKFTKQQARAGKTPWCMAQNAGAGSGWPGAQWIENWFLKHYGAAKLTDWANGKLSWTSPEVTAAWKAFGAVATDSKMVAGGPTTVLSTSVVNNGTGLVSSPPTCSVMLWGVYAGGVTLSQNASLKAGEDLDFFPVPAGSPAHADDELFSGHVAYAFNDNPQTRALLKYWASAPAQSILVASGQWTEANTKIPASAYTNPLLKKASQQLLNGKNLVTGPSMSSSPAIVTAFDKGVVGYIQKPGSLSDILSGIQRIVSTG